METNKTELNNDGVEVGIDTFAVPDSAHGQTVDMAEIVGHVGRLFSCKSIKKVLLVNPPDIDETLFDYNTAKRGRANDYPIYGLGMLARNLIQRGF